MDTLRQQSNGPSWQYGDWYTGRWWVGCYILIQGPEQAEAPSSPLLAVLNVTTHPSVLVYLSRFGMTKFVITETLWSSIIFKTIMVSLHRRRLVVVHLYSIFSVDPLHFPLGANLYQKNAIFRDLLGCRPTFFKPKRWNLACRCEAATPSPVQIL